MQSNYRLVMRSGPSVGKVYPLDKNEIFVGRDLNNDIVINDPEISRRHARMFSQGTGYVLEDLGSTNGSFVNGQRLMGPHNLRPGDVVTFGERLSLVFESSEFDQDATMVSPSSRATYSAPPMEPESSAQVPYPPPQSPVSIYPAPGNSAADPAGPSFAGQVPSAYPPEVLPPERRSPTVWITAAVVLLLLCVCLGVFLFFAPKEFWCLFPVWPAGACP